MFLTQFREIMQIECWVFVDCQNLGLDCQSDESILVLAPAVTVSRVLWPARKFLSSVFRRKWTAQLPEVRISKHFLLHFSNWRDNFQVEMFSRNRPRFFRKLQRLFNTYFWGQPLYKVTDWGVHSTTRSKFVIWKYQFRFLHFFLTNFRKYTIFNSS